jgi:DNA-binding transcriptional regulator YiaG
MMKSNIDPNRLEVYSEGRKRRIYVGELFYLPKKKKYCFRYDDKYRASSVAIPIGPELDLFKKEHFSKADRLFPSFIDRIPSRSNPAYEDYCRAMEISPSEKNQIILLGSIGKRGPSTFVFEPVLQSTLSSTQILEFRSQLKLSRYDLSQVLGCNELTLQRIERGQQSDSFTFRLIEIFFEFPEVALWQLDRTERKVNSEVAQTLREFFKMRLKKPRA